MKYLLSITLLFQFMNLSAQSTFVKMYDDIDNEARSIRKIVEKDGRYFTLSSGICNGTMECSVLMEIDDNGNILWEKKLSWLDVAQNTFVISNDTLVIAGNHNPQQEELFLHYRNLDGDSLTTFTISDPNLPLTNMFVLGLNEFNNKYILTGTGRDSIRSSFLYSVHKEGVLDTLLILDRANANSSAYGISIDQNGYLNVVVERNTQEVFEDVKDYRKYDKDWNVVWNFVTEPILGSYIITKTMTDLDDGSIIYLNQDYWNDRFVIKVDSSKNESWRYLLGDGNKIAANIHRVKASKDGSFIGVGEWFDSTLDEFDFYLEDVPFIFKMTPDGELIWQKAIVQEDPLLINFAFFGAFNDFTELDNGDIIAVGYWGLFPRQKLIARFTSDGCIMEDCDEHYVLTNTEEINSIEEIKIFPNPVSGDFISLDGLFQNDLSYKIYNANGLLISKSKVIRGNGKTQIDISSFTKGMYCIQFSDNKTISKCFNFVKI